MCEQLKAVSELTAAARALTLACLNRSGVPLGPFNHAYDHVACEPVPSTMTALLDQLMQDRVSS
jgi:hypothetical protein